MNAVVKTILKGVEAVAVQVAGPAGAVIDQSVHNIVEHKGDTDESILDAAEASIQLIEHFKGADIADEVKFRMGIAGAEASFKLIRESLKPTPAAAPAA